MSQTQHSPLESEAKHFETALVFTHLKTLSAWTFFSLATNGILIVVVMLLLRQQRVSDFFQAIAAPTQPDSMSSTKPVGALNKALPVLGPRLQLSYDRWIDILKQEAKVAALEHPQHLTILAGDSLSLWFPNELLPPERTWLNQGISGETSSGLWSRLKLFDRTQPEAIFVMIGINDLIRGVRDDVILENQRQIMSYLRHVHPHSQIVVQSILPHSGEQSTWERRDRLLAVSNSRIRQLNRQLQAIAQAQGVNYLNLHALFTDAQGNLRPELTTDGLHLNPQGYLVWRSALQIYTQLKLGNGN